MVGKISNIKMVAFDVGDTLYRVGHPALLAACWKEEQKVLKSFGLKFTVAGYKNAAERAWRESQKEKYKGDFLAVPKLVQEYLGYPSDEKIAEAMGESFMKIAKEYKVKEKHIIENALETLHILHNKKIKLGIISDSETGWARDWFTELKILHYFSVIILSHEIGGKKASGIPFKTFIHEISKLGIKPDEVVFVGDLSVDMDAKKYGIKTILFNPLNNEYDHFEYQPDHVVKNLGEIPKLLGI